MKGMRVDAWSRHNIWEHSRSVADLYRARARDEAEEMDCAAQAVEILSPLLDRGDTLLDVGCGSGYFWHSLHKRGFAIDYWGIDATQHLIGIGKAELPAFGLDPERLVVGRIEDVDGSFDHVLCMNVLSNIDNYHRPLERMLKMARKTVLLRESIRDKSEYRWVLDEYLDPGVRLCVYVNAYGRKEITGFINSYGFSVQEIEDRRSGGMPELSIGYPHSWTFLLARR